MNVDTGQFEAITGELSSLRDEVTRLARRIENATTAEAIIRRAGFPEPALATARSEMTSQVSKMAQRIAHLRLVT